VAERLRNRGWIVRPQIGASGFRVDLGIVDPEAPGAFLAGVECDGATYHRSASARDRDRLRQFVLEELGWRILRVWSTDWWTNAGREADRLHAELEQLLQRARDTRPQSVPMQAVPRPDNPEDDEGGRVSTGPRDPDSDDAKAAEDDKPDSRDGDVSGGGDRLPVDIMASLDPGLFHDPGYRPQISALIMAILTAYGPLREDRLAQRVARAHGFQRTGAQIWKVVAAARPKSCRVTHEAETTFVWPPDVAPDNWSVFRDPEHGQHRDPAETPIQELAALARRVLHQASSDDEALVMMRDACGLEKLREAARVRCIEALDRARPRALS
jgi:hypothetical protein